MNSVASVKARLKNKGIESGKTMQEMLTLYGLERTIYRLSISKYREFFTLKGGIFLYALYEGDYARATTDIDLRAERISNDVNDMQSVFEDVFSIEADDPLRFDLDSLKVKSITEFKKYHGVNVYINCFLDRTKIDISIDIGFGDVIYPGRTEMEFPVVLSDEAPQIYAYSLCSSIAEKFEAIVSLAYDNSRFKDYYDIYVLSTTRDFEGKELREACKETFEYRKTPLNEIVAFEKGFANDPLRQSRWNSFVKKKKPLLKISLEDTISVIEGFLGPVADSIVKETDFEGKWSCENEMWL